MAKPPHLKRAEKARPKSTEDTRQLETVKAAGDHVIDVIKRLLEGNRDKMIRELNREQVDLIATAAINGWVLKRAEIEAGEPEDPLIDFLC
jgi:hypothetical protein